MSLDKYHYFFYYVKSPESLYNAGTKKVGIH